VQRLKTRAQFEAVMAGGSTVSRTPHFALHRAAFPPSPAPDTPPAAAPAPSDPTDAQPKGRRTRSSAPLFAVQAEPWMGAIVPKRWARRAVTRNAIKRQIYTVSQDFEAQLTAAVHVVRLRAGFDKSQFPSATSEALKRAVRTELQQLFAGVRR
jgi:ribonuclease P protein component